MNFGPVNENENDPTPTDGETVGSCGHGVGSAWGLLTDGAFLQFSDGCKARRFGACKECIEAWGEGPPDLQFHGTWIESHEAVVQCPKGEPLQSKSDKVWMN
jgi:hypothetical protein